MRIKTEKSDRIMFDSEHSRMTNGHWAIVWNPAKFQMADKEIAGAIASGRSFERNGRGFDFSPRIPNIPAFMEEAYERVKADYKPAVQTGWARMMGGYYAIEYKTESGEKFYIKDRYSEMMDEIGAVIMGKDKESAVYVVDEDCVCAVFMPVNVKA